MDIREAVAKIEELQRLAAVSAKKANAQNTLLFNIPLSEQFTGSFALYENFEANGGGEVSADFTFDIENPTACEFTVSAYLNDCEIESKIIAAGGGKGQYAASFLFYAEAGKHQIKFTLISGGASASTLKGACIKLFGNIKSATGNVKLITRKESGIPCAAYNDEKYVYYSTINGENLITARRYLYRGDYTFCVCRHEDEGYDALYFYTEEGKLFMQVIPCTSGFEPYGILIDEGVTSVSAEESVSPCGCVLYYLKGGNVYGIIARKEENGLILPCSGGIVANSPLASKVSAVSGLDCCGFILTERNGLNSLYLHKGQYCEADETINAQIEAYLE
jgi:hypothetical protein